MSKVPSPASYKMVALAIALAGTMLFGGAVTTSFGFSLNAGNGNGNGNLGTGNGNGNNGNFNGNGNIGNFNGNNNTGDYNGNFNVGSSNGNSNSSSFNGNGGGSGQGNGDGSGNDGGGLIWRGFPWFSPLPGYTPPVSGRYGSARGCATRPRQPAKNVSAPVAETCPLATAR